MTEQTLTAADFIQFAKQTQAPLADLFEAVSSANNWQDRYRQLMQGAKLLPALPPELQTETARVRGCESAAWLYHCQVEGKHLFIADSEARIVKGLIALLLHAVNNSDSQTLAQFEPKAYLKRLGLEGQLSPSRSNGLYALISRIIELSRE
ncbi:MULTISPECIES: SufE family protein [Shewanella]|jgi:cysteine desulfuration protein SufE|uniref:Fe-S metabolism protein SufE n=1 Tax=Shewanella chilikensis TaxID=558541 RepID=A0A6G7LV40_9GAMM|nr:MULTISPECIES: SufE family protein [Shewanella]MCA0951719.1 SufE family protein [Shewanella chilikensis]MCL1163031.1 SufE family protein [Shewanella chilikensis]QIJ05683.1 Fe-S metabolism protein SufE [Shewanella chilikensis]HCD13104.1 Fe-S metabolism protein SufE [Shewanella sp.]